MADHSKHTYSEFGRCLSLAQRALAGETNLRGIAVPSDAKRLLSHIRRKFNCSSSQNHSGLVHLWLFRAMEEYTFANSSGLDFPVDVRMFVLF